MPANVTRVALTSTEAKLAFKKNGSGLSSRQQRELARAAELDQRAAQLREREENRKIAKRKRLEREKKEREARQRNGVGLATQIIGYSHTQAQLKNGMEAFLGYRKKTTNKTEGERRKEEEREKVDEEVAKKIEVAVKEAAGEPWDEEDGDAFDLPELESNSHDQFEDDLDDDTLLEVHDLIMSNPPVERSTNQDPNFKLPGLSASKTNSIEPLSLLDGWDDFLDSGTQIARELSQEKPAPAQASKPQTVSPAFERNKLPALAQAQKLQTVSPASKSNELAPLSTQELDFLVEDLIDSPEAAADPKQPALPVPLPQKSTSATAITIKGRDPQVSKPLANHHAKRLPPPQPKPLATHSAISRHPSPPAPQPLKRRAQSNPAGPVLPLKRAVMHPGHLAQPCTSFSDFGLSTQEAVSFFSDDDDDDDDLAFGSPVEIMV